MAAFQKEILKLWGRLKNKPGGKWLFSRGIGRFVPYSGSISATVEELAPGVARVSMADRKRLRNHLNSVHAIAIMNLAELTTGLAVLCALPENCRGIVKGLKISYEKKGRGTLLGECRVTLPEFRVKTEFKVDGVIKDAQGDVVAKAEAFWVIGPEA